MLELKKDALFPDRYIRAGERKTLEEWEKIFGKIAESELDIWFIDLDKLKLKNPDPLTDIINEVFEYEGLHSITYKQAARIIARRYAALISSQNNKLSHS